MFEKRIEILKKISNENWVKKLKSNRENYEQYDRTYENNKDDAQNQLKNLLPKYFEIIHLVNNQRIREGKLPNFQADRYDVGIFLVGHSVMPVILSIAEIRPREVIFLVSQDTRDLVDEITDAVKSLEIPEIDQQTKMLEKISDPAKVFEDINRLIKAYEGKKIAVDITGGKKTMVAGSFMASAWSKTCDIFYIDFEEYETRDRRPVYGTEFLAKLPNPSEIFSIADWERIESLFDHYQFGQVSDEIDRIEDNIRKYEDYFDEEIRKKILEIRKYASAYESWDDYRYSEAVRHLPENPALMILSAITKHYEDSVVNYSRSKSKRDADEKAIGDNRKEIYDKSEWLAYYTFDRLNNARRRKSQGQLQGAFLRFISLTEFILTLWGDANITGTERENVTDRRGNMVFGKIIGFLANKNHRMIRNIDRNELDDLRNIRNSHIMVHSIKVIGESEVIDKAESIACQIIRNALSEIKKMDITQIEKIENELKFESFREVIA